MSYTANTWSKGDTITAAKLNTLENGVSEAAAAADSAAEAAETAQSTAEKAQNAADGAFSELQAIPINHRNFYRGKYLGSEVTADQQAMISAGTFDDLYVGDYWTIGGINWRIADINYWYNCGDTAFTTNHLIIVPDTRLYAAAMHSSGTTEGGYVASEMYTANLDTAKETITAAFGNLVLTHRDYLTNAITSGRPSGATWYDSTVELMTEKQVHGCNICGAMSIGSAVANRATINRQQFALFRLNPNMAITGQAYWLQDIVSAYNYAYVSVSGCGHNGAATISYGVRPVFAIGVA